MTAPGARSAAPADEALVARFKEALDRLWPHGGKLGLAVSGGPDSLALLLLADAAIPGGFEVATVDHGLRKESAAESAMVARLCAERDIACDVLDLTLAPGNRQARARDMRYTALLRWAEARQLAAICTAHHADDQAETLLMRLNRGSGVEGLAAIRAVQRFAWSKVPVVRPLLALRKRDLVDLVAASGLVPAEDPSNADDRYDRARIRKALASASWLDIEAVAASAGHLADAEEALDHYEQLILAEHGFADREYAGISRPAALTREGQRRLVRWALSEFDGYARGSDIARLVERLRAGKGGNLGGVMATVEGEDWVFRPEPPRRST
jgi:tRNA(Ile)-lysidine synthase